MTNPLLKLTTSIIRQILFFLGGYVLLVIWVYVFSDHPWFLLQPSSINISASGPKNINDLAQKVDMLQEKIVFPYETKMSLPVSLEFKFHPCVKAHRYQLYVGDHGRDSINRVPSTWKIFGKLENSDKMTLLGEEKMMGIFILNDSWHEFEINNSDCYASYVLQIEKIANSNVLRIYDMRFSSFTLGVWLQNIFTYDRNDEK